MKKAITIIIIVLVALGLGWYLFRISPNNNGGGNTTTDQLDTSGVVKLDQPPAVSADDFVLGNKDAKNTLLVYEDFQCPACASFESVLSQVSSALKDTKVVFRIFPLYNIHQNSIPSSYAAYAAGAQGKFWEFTKILFEKQTEWGNLSDPILQFTTYAQAAGVPSLDQFKSDITSKKYKPQLEKDLKEALGLNLEGTPSVFFNNKEIQYGDINKIKSQVESLYK